MALTRLPSFTLLSTDSYTFGNANVSGNVAAGNLKTDHLLYANGAAWSFATISGSNTQVQFNDNGNFGSSANLTFDKTSNTLTVTYIVANGSSLSSITGANVTGAVSYATTANSVAGANVSGAVSYATTANSVAGANVTGQVGNALVAGTVYTAAQPNITSVGTLTSLSVTGNIASGNANLGNLVTANFFSGNGHYLTDILGTQVSGEVAYANKANSVAGSNVTGQVGNALVAGTVYTNAQPNITSVGTLTSITTTGDASVGGNLSVTGNLTVSGTVTSVNSTTVNINDINIVLANNATTAAQANGGGITINGAGATMLYNSTSNAFVFSHPISANGALLSNIAGANVTGAVSYATTANSVAGANVSGAVAYATTANSVAGSNVSGAVNLATYAGTANAVAGANVSGAVSYATTANSVAGANVSGEVSYAAVANSVAVANVVGIGNIATINKDGNASNILYGNGVFASAPVTYANSNVATFLSSFGSNTITTTGDVTVGNIIGNGQALTGLTGANVTGEVGYAAVANSVAVANVSGIGNIATINKDGNASNILYGNGVFAAAPTGGGGSSYGDSNVATYLPNYAGNLSPGNLSIGVSNLHITGGTNGYVLKTDGSGNLSWVAQSGGSGGTGASVTVSDTAPSTPNQGDLWLDSASGELNVYFGGAWASVTESATQFTSTVNYFTGDGATTTFTLTTTPASKEYTLVAVGGVLQPRNTYTISGTTLTFSSAIPNTTPIEVTILGGTAAPVGVATTVTASSQPNITSTGTLVDLQATGNILFNGNPPTSTGKAIAMSIVFGF